jgi:DNA-binding response OmpR family regulator
MARPNIVVVDHDPAFLRLVAGILEAEGFEPKTLDSTSEAYEMIVQSPPDLVVQESWVEDKEAGWMLLQKLLLDKRVSSIPVLFISSDPADLQRRAGSLEGLPHVWTMTKPFTPETLLKMVREILGPVQDGG